MALWYDCGNGFKKISFARKSLNADAYLYAPGPSLKEVNNKNIHRRGAMSFAINTAYPYIKPDVWIGLDLPECYDRGLWDETFIKICRSGYHRTTKVEGRLIKDFCNVFFADTEKPEREEQLFEWREHDTKFIWHENTLAFAIHFMVWMGAKKIHFVGTDLGGLNEDYYDDRILAPELRKRNQRLYRQQVEYLKRMNEVAKKNGIEMISCTANSPINKFMEYKPLLVAFENTTNNLITKPGGKIYHAREAHDMLNKNVEIKNEELLRWNENIHLSKGVMIGFDSKVEWMFDWWYDNYRKYNTYPVVLVDMGLSKEKRKEISTKVFVVDLPDTGLGGWFNKPFAMIKTIFENTIWMDIDCEVRGDVEPIFKYSDCSSQMAVTRDPYTPFSKTKDPIASGVVVFKYNNKAIIDWAKMVYIEHKNYRGDQEVLDMIREKTKLGIMPMEYNWFRLAGDVSKEAIIVHWSGPEGKEDIKKKINKSFNKEHWITHLIRVKRFTSGIIIGVDRGETFLYLLQNCPSLVSLAGVDLYKQQNGTKESKKDSDYQADYDYVLKELEKINKDKKTRRGHLHKMTTDEFHETIHKEPVWDFIFIEKHYSSEGLRRDIKNYALRLKDDGYLIGHNINNSVVYGVVKKLCPGFQRREDNLWFIAKKDLKWI